MQDLLSTPIYIHPYIFIPIYWVAVLIKKKTQPSSIFIDFIPQNVTGGGVGLHRPGAIKKIWHSNSSSGLLNLPIFSFFPAQWFFQTPLATLKLIQCSKSSTGSTKIILLAKFLCKDSEAWFFFFTLFDCFKKWKFDLVLPVGMLLFQWVYFGCLLMKHLSCNVSLWFSESLRTGMVQAAGIQSCQSGCGAGHQAQERLWSYFIMRRKVCNAKTFVTM